ncbi:zinc finger protein ZPR1 isoform X1 [Danaus plexippus]|uniref:zinc finger protein ZPR1 isoform X1 n=1 Tax=Danaus plexippus TaxID=13037 RepID=UPI002AB2D003|nr:zinc finger protein ZPR1 isoform X1 [Danaus plexippus]
MCEEQKPLFRDLAGDDPEPEVTEIESLCLNCHENGMTRLLLTRIPHYKNVVIMSFNCEHCGFENNEIQPGGAYAELGVRWKLNIQESRDLNRQVVKSDHTAVIIPELDFEIPALSQKGEVTTVEGIISRAITGLTQDQAVRRQQHPEHAEQIDQFVAKLEELRSLQKTWTLIIEDITGNCFVENPEAPKKDPGCVRTDFKRSKEDDIKLGIYTEGSQALAGALTSEEPSVASYDQLASDEVLQFRTNCPECNAPADTNMKITKIPHFKEVVIMATVCDACGHRTNEVKSGGGVEEKGVKFEVKIRNREDFTRDILKSETCNMGIPELELEVGGAALGGRFTTVEGVLTAVKDQMREGVGLGDAGGEAREKVERCISSIDEILEGKSTATLILDDPAGNSYVQNLSDDPTVFDDGLKVVHYERSYEQNDELGLNDMKTEGYAES